MTIKNKDGTNRELAADIEKKRKAAFEAISKKAMLVNLERKQLANYIFDVQFSEKVRKEFKIESPGMLQVRKCIINPQHFANVRSIINDAMLMLWNHTRPWDNIGFRLLPMDLYDDFNDVFTKIKDEFEEAVQLIVDNWDKYVEEAKKLLGKAFNQADYPASTDVREMFELKVTTHQLPDIDDVRLNLSGEELLDLEDEIRDKYNLNMTDARSMLQGNISMLISLIGNDDHVTVSVDKKELAGAAHTALTTLADLNQDATDPELAVFIENSITIVAEHYDAEAEETAKVEDDGSIGSGLLIDDVNAEENADLKEYDL